MIDEIEQNQVVDNHKKNILCYPLDKDKKLDFGITFVINHFIDVLICMYMISTLYGLL